MEIHFLICLSLIVVHLGNSVENIKCLYRGYETNFVFKDLIQINVPSESIFFLETTCKHEAGVDLSPRQACSIESAALNNPHSQVYVVIISSVGNRTQSPVIQWLYEYKNVEIVQVNLDRLFQNTPLYNFYTEDKIVTSGWPIHHMSDILRSLILYTYGGTYLDLDILVLKSLEHMHNYAGAESGRTVGASIIHIDKGHWLSSAAVKELSDHYDGNKWSASSVGIMTELLTNECEKHQSFSEKIIQCRNFTIYPPFYFYPIHYYKWTDYFNENKAPSTMTKIEPSLAIHVWNKLSEGTPVQLNSQQPYAQFARRYCPRISDLAGDTL